MLQIPPYFLLFPFGIFLLGFVFFSLANIISLAKYGARNAVGFLVIFIFISGSALILFLASQALQGMAWTTSVPVLETQAPSPL